MAERPHDLTAAPPDDGGHQGAFTRPGDTLVRGDSAAPGDDPPLHFDTTEARPVTQSAGLALAITAALVLAAYALFGVYLPS